MMEFAERLLHLNYGFADPISLSSYGARGPTCLAISGSPPCATEYALSFLSCTTVSITPMLARNPPHRRGHG